MTRSEFLSLVVSGAASAGCSAPAPEPNPEPKPRKLVLIAGKPSHPPGMHEFRAGSLILETRLRQVPGLTVECYDQGWVDDDATLEDADALVIYADGGAKHPAVEDGRLALIESLIQRGMGFGCMHYGVEVLADDAGEEFQRWLGGYYEHEFSCNPIWTPSYESFPDHPVSRGVKPFAVEDEWYFNIRFQAGFNADGRSESGGMKFTPVLVATPSDETRDGPYVYPVGPYDHVQAAKGRKEAMLWAVERADGGRGFGFTGGHFHRNWQNDDYRKVVLNALCWTAGLDIPLEGVASRAVDNEEIGQNMDAKG